MKLFCVSVTGLWNQEGVLASYQALLSEVCVICGSITYNRWFTKQFFLLVFEEDISSTEKQFAYDTCNNITFTVLVYSFCNNNIIVFHFDDSLTDLLWHLLGTSWTSWEMILKKIRQPVVTECLKI
jgi:hypothetical protein